MQCIMLLRAQRPSRWPGWQAASGWSSRCADHARPPHWRVEGRAATGVDEFGVAVEGRTFLELIWSVAGPPQLRPPLPGLVLHQKGRSLASKNFQVFSQFLAKMFKTSFVSNVAFGPLTRLPWSSRTESGCVWMINLNLFGIWSATWKQLDRSSVILTALFRRSSSWSSYNLRELHLELLQLHLELLQLRLELLQLRLELLQLRLELLLRINLRCAKECNRNSKGTELIWLIYDWYDI